MKTTSQMTEIGLMNVGEIIDTELGGLRRLSAEHWRFEGQHGTLTFYLVRYYLEEERCLPEDWAFPAKNRGK